MATTDQVVDTEIIFLLAITEPDHQVVWLSRLVNLFQTPEFLLKLRNVDTSEIGHKTIIEALEKEVAAEK
jgi:mannitol/fructose-specific phosphotransferase system IIA component (Ntr-type)